MTSEQDIERLWFTCPDGVSRWVISWSDYLTLRAEITSLRSALAEARKERDEARAELHEFYVDDVGTVWTRPTAFAYHAVCKALGTHKAAAESSRDTAVEALREAKAVLESISMSCNEGSFYKDCYLKFHQPHSYVLRLTNDSSKSFIIADFEARRRATLTKLGAAK